MSFFFFKQKTAYEIKECDWSSDVCSSDLMAELNGKGRIIGSAKNAPDFKVTVFTSTIQSVRTVRSEKLDNGSKVYEVQLEPGKYILAVDAKGYETLDIKDLEVRAGQDLELDLKFSKKQT